jgi:tellurite resistance protein TehA-like permease
MATKLSLLLLGEVWEPCIHPKWIAHSYNQILDIVLFAFFTVMSLLRAFLYPKVAVNIMHDFTQTSFLGAIPVTLDTIIIGIVIFYSHHSAAVWTALGFYWVSVSLTLVVVFGSVFVVYSRQGEVQLSNVTGT